MDHDIKPDFSEESKKLAEAWMSHAEDFLWSYLTFSEQNPLVNPQSILSRYSILEYLCDDDVSEFKYHELLFSSVMLWCYEHANDLVDTDLWLEILDAIAKGADATEYLAIPPALKTACNAVINFKGKQIRPQYMFKAFVEEEPLFPDEMPPDDDLWELKRVFPSYESLCEFVNIWKQILPELKIRKGTVLEPACGSANDYRVLHEMGLTNYIDYSGFDICPKNISNALEHFPRANFFVADVYQYEFKRDYDVIFVHDLFEHLSIQGAEFALGKLCKHCKGVLNIGFFNMDDIPDHVVRPVKNYHWNTLSLGKIHELIKSYEFDVQIIHINTMLKELFNMESSTKNGIYNPRAYTFICRKK